jgi:2-oxoglutarate ferredoxin oxidoreductase subunit alpha
LVGWGSTKGAICEAVDRLNAQGQAANAYHFVDIWPMPGDAVTELLGSARRLVSVEQNYSGQLASLIRKVTGLEMDRRINKFDGRQLSPDYILAKLEEEAKAGV